MLKTTLEELERYVYIKLGHDRNNYYGSMYRMAYEFFFSRRFNEKNVAEFISYLENKKKEDGSPLSRYTINNYIKALKKLGHLEGFNLDSWKLKKAERPHIAVLEDDEIVRVVKRAYDLSYRYGLITELILRHGLRIGEVRNLTWQNFYGRSIYVTKTKTNNAREIQILPDIESKIEKLRGNHEAYIFGTYKGQLDMSTYNVFLKEVYSDLGIRKYVTAHKLRHSYATSSDGNGVSLRLIQDTLGHTDIRTTQYYIHTTQKRLREAAKKSVLAVYQMDDKEMRGLINEITFKLTQGNKTYDMTEDKNRIMLIIYKD